MSRRGENIFKRKDGRWEARYIHHYENGQAKYRFLYGRTYAEAKEKRQEEMRLLPREPDVRSRCRFRELGNLWLESIRVSVKESTYTRYRRILFQYIYPRVGDIQVSHLDVKAGGALTGSLLESGGVNGGALAPKTVSDILCVLKAVLRYGRENRYPCADLQGLRAPLRQKAPVQTFGKDARTRLEQGLLAARDTVSLGILTTLYTGVRIGELCGLRWEDVDLENGLIHVRHTVERIANLAPGAEHKTKVVISEPKTENSARLIPIQRFLLDYLRDRKCSSSCYLLTGTEKHTEPRVFYGRYQTVLRSKGLPPLSFHALRHTFATRCVETGFDVKSLSEILGHANISTTLSVYVHPSMDSKRRQMELLTPEHSQSK